MSQEPEIVEVEETDGESILMQTGYPENISAFPLMCSVCDKGFHCSPLPSFCPECGNSFTDETGAVRFDEETWKEQS